MLDTKPMYSLRDVAIVPETISFINSRSECNPFTSDNTLPIFTAPMSSVVNMENLHLWKENNIIPIVPRNINYDTRISALEHENWVAFSLKEFTTLNLKGFAKENYKYYILIDCANGHMESIYEVCKFAKEDAIENNYELYLMVGNIANPDTIEYIVNNYNKTFVDKYNIKIIDYIRVGIGSGNLCTTTSQTSIHYGMASLINDINSKKLHYNRKYYPKIIADGGIKTYNDAITALALGADYVMVGSSFGALFESAADFVNDEGVIFINAFKYPDKYTCSEDKKLQYIKMESLRKCIYGMSTYIAQKEIKSSENTKRYTEGIGRFVDCNKTIKQYADEFAAYLKSCMSYCNCRTLHTFIGEVQCKVMSPTLHTVINNSIDNHVNDTIHIVK